MAISKTSAGRHAKKNPRHQPKAPTVLSLLHHNLPTTERRKRSWTPEQLFDANFLKVPASVWKNIHDPSRTEWMDAAENTLTSTLAAGALLSRPIVGLVKVHKWFWDKSIETKDRKDTYRYRVIDQVTDEQILPENEWYDPVEDDETKMNILFVGLPFKEHTLWLLRRICPDASMDAMQTRDQWREYLLPSIRAGYSQIKKSTTYGWAPVANHKKGRKVRLPIPTVSPPPKKSVMEDIAR